MRWLVLGVLVSACNVSDFERYSFATAPDLGLGGSDLAAFVSDGGGGGRLGAACTTTSTCAAIWSCFSDNNGWPNGFCSATCNPADPTFCHLDGDCQSVNGQSVCLPKCDPALGSGCRNGYACCDGQGTTNGPGNCAPSNTKFCGK